MCNNHVITPNTTVSVHLPVGPQQQPDPPPPAIRAAKPQPRRPSEAGGHQSPGGGGPAPPRSGAPSRRHGTPVLGVESSSSPWVLITFSHVCVYSQQYCLSHIPLSGGKFKQ